jgi:hypothetical protein
MVFPKSRILLAVACLSFVNVAGRGQVLTPEERQLFHNLLRDHQGQFMAALSDVTHGQWTFKPSPDQWSISEIAEHIVLADGLYLTIVGSCLAKPANESEGRKLRGKENILLKELNDQEIKAEAPSSIRPTNKYPTKAEAINAFEEQMVLASDFLGSHSGFTNHTTAHPQFGELSAYQWMLMIPGHGNRHVAQILAVKESPGYPIR